MLHPLVERPELGRAQLEVAHPASLTHQARTGILCSPLSYQRHERRAEHWFVVAGQGMITLDGGTIEVQPGDSADVPRGAAHRIQNTGSVPLVFVEVQHGDYFGEDDIVRLDDDYGRLEAEAGSAD